MPPPVHPDDTAEGHVRSKLRRGRAWVACAEDQGVVGFSLTEDDWLDMLYVVPESAGQGIGSSLLEVVKHEHPGGFALWVFESNAPARRFYRRRGLVELERTDGTDNEEQQPDIRMAWPGHQPMAYLRSQVDEVDARLAAVVNRRVALTREIQRHKPVPGHAGRDDAREAEIAEQMSRIVPSLRVEEWRRIVHAVISVSLDAADREGRTDR
jgi:chorismate mutase